MKFLQSETGLNVNGDGTATVTALGTLENLNTALDGLSFAPTTNFSGPAMLTISINDQGNTGAGGALSATATVSLTVAPGTPTASAQTVSVAFNTAKGFTLAGSDPDVPALLLTNSAENVRFYESHGFEVVLDAPMRGGLPTWAMVRQPR